MKKLIFIFFCLFFIYMIYSFIFSSSSEGHTISYIVQDGYEVEEQYDKSDDHYVITITKDEMKYRLIVPNEFSTKKEIIENIASLEDESYQCIYPIFKNEKNLTDVLCIKNGIIYPYHSIKNPLKKLIDFATPFVEKVEVKSKSEIANVKLYDSLPDNHYLGVTNYKGLYLVNKKIVDKELFKKDSYERSIQLFTPKYYVSADYNQTYEFNEFLIVNLENGKLSTITFDRAISMDGYIQGFVGDNIYMIDRSSKKQYEVSLQRKTVKEIGNVSKGMKVYRDGDWKIEKFSSALNQEYHFNEYTSDTNFLGQSYAKVDKVGDYTYLYKKVENMYEVYRSIEKTLPLQYLFTVNDLENVVYVDKGVYFKDGKQIMMYQDKYGVIPIFENVELEFNQNLRFGIYERE